MRLHPTRRDGLSLIEVLTAMAIFLMALVALTYLVNTSSNLAAEAQYRARAAQICRSKMNEICAGSLAIEAQSLTAVEDEPEYQFAVEVEAGATQALQNVTVRVRHGQPDAQYHVEVAMSRMLLDPKFCGSTQDVPASPAGSSSDSMTESGSTPSDPKSGTQPAGGGTAPKGGGTTSPKGGGTTAPKGGGSPPGGGGTAPKGGGSAPKGGGSAPKGGGTAPGSGAKGR